MIGKIVNGKYRIDSLKGVGGMAKVYKAHDLTTGDTVAIKFLKEENQQNAEYVRRFSREAQAGMSLNHPNIVKLLDTGVEDGVNYIVFEYVNGPTLKDYIQKHGVFSPKIAVNIIGHILDAIGYAHEHGIIHRDVKPQNIIITANGTVKLADFGIARLMNASTRSFTGVNAMGSVHYISPEQAEGKETTYQTDLYSVGIILYEMLTGQVPFDNTNEVSVAVMHIKDKMRAPMEINPDISYALNAVILKSASKKLSLRYASAVEMKNDLLRALREPDGHFADLPDVDEEENGNEEEPEVVNDANMVGNFNRGVFIALMALTAVIVIIIGAFIIVKITYKPKVAVKNLIGMTLEEAEALMGKDFKFVIDGEDIDKEYGCIIEQDPSEGTRLEAGSTVEIKLRIVAPDLKNMNPGYAADILKANGLNMGEIVYEVNEDAVPGRIFKQEPDADEELDYNSKVNVYVSVLDYTEAAQAMPNITNKDLNTAVAELKNLGFTKIIVRPDKNTDANENTVTSQALDAGLMLSTDTYIFITAKVSQGNYEADFACSPNVGVHVLITVDTGDGYEIVMYEAEENDDKVVSITAYLHKAGAFDCKLYESGNEKAVESKTFTETKS